MAEIIALANQKGGVAKTTSVHNIACGLAKRSKRTLMIDLDSQASLTICAGLEPNETAENSIYSVITDDKRDHKGITECIYEVGTGDYNTGNCFIVPSIIDLANLEYNMRQKISSDGILKRAIEPIQSEFDYIIIDCPPQLSILTVNALSCSNGVIIPVKTDYLAYRGLQYILDTIDDVQNMTNAGLRLYGIIATIFEKVSTNDKAIFNILKNNYNVLGVIPKRVMISKGVYDGLAIVEHAPESDLSIAYMNIVDKIISGDFSSNMEDK